MGGDGGASRGVRGGGADALSLVPSREERERVRREVEELVGEVAGFLRERGVEAEVKPAGSSVVGTFVRGEHDYDVFVVTQRVDEVFDLLRGFRRDMRRKMGELRIWNFRWRGANVDLVVVPPNYEKIGTLKHAEFYSSALSDEEKDEVVKGKLLFKSFGAYGAEVGGITGVALQELVRRKGSLEEVCRDILEWEKVPFVQDAVLARRRSLTASIAPVRVKSLKRACEAYLRGGLGEFKPYGVDRFVEEREAEGMRCVVAEYEGDKGKAFTSWLSRCEARCNELKSLERDAVCECECDAYADGGKVAVCFRVSQPREEYVVRCVDKEKAGVRGVEAFKAKNPDWFEEDGKVCAKVRRKVADYEGFMLEGLKKEE